MPHSVLNRIVAVLAANGCPSPRLRAPQLAHVQADVVLSGEGVTEQVARILAQDRAVAHAEFVTAVRCINLRLEDAALFAQHLVANEALQADDDTRHALRYAYFRACALADAAQHAQGDGMAARKLAVALLVLGYSPNGALGDMIESYGQWHDSVLVAHATQFCAQHNSESYGDLMQKEAIQYPASSALLARSAANSLRQALHMLKIEPTKDWAV